MARQERQSSSATLPEPLRHAASVLRKVPGAGLVSRATEGALDKVGAVSPRGRRMAVYAGAGVLGVAGVVEWPVAVTGAAVAWLTQPRPRQPETSESETPVSAEDGAPAVEEAMSTPVGTDPTATGAVPPPVTEVTAPLGPTPTPPGAESSSAGRAPAAEGPGPVPTPPVTDVGGPTPTSSGGGSSSAGSAPAGEGPGPVPTPPVTDVGGMMPTSPGAESAPTGTGPIADAPGPTPPHPGAEAAPAVPAPAADVPGPTAPEPGAPGPAESLTGRSGAPERPDRTTD
jgi:hypothetical protein